MKSRRETTQYKEATELNTFYSDTYHARRLDKLRREKAANMVNKAIANGDMVRGCCSVCGATEKVDGHHENYDLPLDVTWLCKKHHAQRHIEIRAAHGGGYNSKYKKEQ